MVKKKEYHDENLIEIKDGKAIIAINLPDGKTTTEDAYPKLKEDKECSFPERASCNHGSFFSRCPYMEYDNSQGPFSSNRWRCTFKK